MYSLIKKELPYFIGNDNGTDSVVLFIHGLGGNYWTWKSFAFHLKKYWNEKDSFGLEYEEYYDNQNWLNRIPFIRKALMIYKILTGPGIDVLSETLRTSVEEACDQYDNVIIIGHSMGGLVARKYIIDLLEETKSLGKIKALITYATPHKGSKWAKRYLVLCYHFLRHFIKDSKQISQLDKTGEFITDLNNKWSEYKVDDKIDYYRIIGLSDWVVDIESSQHYDDIKAKKIASKGHFNIIKPFRKTDRAFMVSYNYLKNFKQSLSIKIQQAEELGYFGDGNEQL